ncbi:TIGR03943 family putative permease subunit [Ureibacillus aquaedulcis]|uniref:TIGR03943 family protein n=1 Tax=Ureibacillus aquaedulcis TaxID=3058421 RepID=A0ABT8GU54_9BACL|nr:TIGR03943 family protein [Ureibacillus sp. BA0131]MDN4494917.1 TIGR03943 family protein [Ureibacillus sp. BA0131]
MKFHFQHFLKALLLGLFTLFFANLHITGDIIKYINPKYDYMSKMTVIFFFVLLLIQVTRIWQEKHTHHVCSHRCDHDHGNSHWSLRRVVSYSIVAFPIVTGFMVPPATLDASIAANKGFLVSQGGGQSGGTERKSLMEGAESLVEKEDIDIYSSEHVPLPNENYLSEQEYDGKLRLLQESESIQMTEDMFSTYYGEINDNLESYVGKTIKMSGFVFKEEGLTGNQLVISRFLITHCVADASIIGFLTEFTGAVTIQEDAWVEIEGVLEVGNYNGYDLPLLKATSLNVVEEPSEPYIYPVLKMLGN